MLITHMPERMHVLCDSMQQGAFLQQLVGHVMQAVKAACASTNVH